MVVDHDPFSPSMTVRAARDAYLAENGFTVEAYDAKYTDASFPFFGLGIKLKVPNTEAHRVGIMLHDLHHVATGFGTDLVGEGEISAWEARRGLMALGVYVATIVTSGAFMGLAFAPRRTLHAWRASRAGHASLFPLCKLPRDELAKRYDALLEMTVSELRTELGVPARGVAEHPRKLHAYAPTPPTMA